MSPDRSRRGGDSAGPPLAIREEVARHRVQMFAYREYGPDRRWRQQPTGFDVDLRALVLGERPMGDVQAQALAYEVLRSVACWALAVLDARPSLSYTIDEFDRHVLFEGGNGPVEVELDVHIVHADDVRRQLDDEERTALEEVRKRLRAAGVRD